MRLLVPLALLAATFAAHAADPAKMSPAAAAYYRCMVDKSAAYAKKAADASEAIDAATSRCEERRENLRIDLSAEIITEDIMAGRSRSEYQTNRIVTSTLQKLDERIRPDLVRTVLEAK